MLTTIQASSPIPFNARREAPITEFTYHSLLKLDKVVTRNTAQVDHGKDLLIILYLNWIEVVERRSAQVDHGKKLLTILNLN